MEFVNYSSIYAMLTETVGRYGEGSAYKWFKEPGLTDSVTWNQFFSQVRQVGKSLIALGVEKGDKVNILSYSRYQWVLSDLGITSIGSVTVGIYQSNLPKDVLYIVDHSDAVVIFAECGGPQGLDNLKREIKCKLRVLRTWEAQAASANG